MLLKRPEPGAATGFATFDREHRLLAANTEMFGPSDVQPADLVGLRPDQVFPRLWSGLQSFDGSPVGTAGPFPQALFDRWLQAGAGPIEVETTTGLWKLLTAHSNPEGSRTFVSVDITHLKQAEIATQVNAEMFRCIADSHPLPVWVVDEETHRIYYESLDASRLLGRKWTPKQAQYISGKHVDLSDLQVISALLKKAGIVRDYELRVTQASGSVVWCSANFRRTVYRERPCIVVGVLDITDRKKRENLLSFLIEHHPLPVWMNDAKTGEVIYHSKAAEKLFAWGGPDANSPRLRDYFVEDRQYLEFSRMLFETGRVDNYEARLKRADGQEFWAVGNALLADFEGRQVTLSGIADVTRKKKRDAEISMAREMLADAVESLSEGFALYDEDQRLVMCNRRYREMNNHSQNIIEPGSDWAELLRRSLKHGVFPDAIGREPEWIQDRLRNGIEFTKGYEIRAGDGSWRSVSIHPTELGGFVVTCTDISERKQLESAERDANALVHRVLDACPLPTRMSTIEGESLYRNPASMALYGPEATAANSFVRPADRERLVKLVVENGRVDDFRTQQYKADGTPFWASISSRLIHFQGRRLIVSNATDISDLVAAQEEIRHANERLIDAIESLSEGFALYDKNDRLVLANSQYRKMHAISSDVLVPGVNWFDFLRVTAERKQFPVAEDDIDAWLQERAKDRREFRQQEFRHTDGQWFFVSNCPTREGGFVVTRLDITERKRAEIAQGEADELVRRVLEACPVNIQMTRLHDGKLLYRSPAAGELLGEVATAKDYYVSAKEREHYVDRLLRDRYIDDFETQLRRKDGAVIWCSISSRLIDFHGENVIVSHTFDLTDRIRMQLELERQRETLHQNEKLSALGELLAGVAHELNNPLSVVLGQSLLLKDTTNDPRAAERSEKIISAADRCARIVKTFLAIARQAPARMTNAALAETIDAAIAVAGYAINSSHIELGVDVPHDLPPIWADPDQLSQVFINLLVNAEQALRNWDGERRIMVSAQLDPAFETIHVKVFDSGPGISGDILPRIFEPFFTTKEVGSGTGIGLSFCHRIVQSHGGTIRAESVAGQGTSFIVTLPVSHIEKSDTPQAPDAAGVGYGLSCLLVEDEEDVGSLIFEILRRDGIHVCLAKSGAEALFHLGHRNFDFILSDLKMPNMDGRRFFKHLADHHPHMRERLGFITGDTMSPDAQNFLTNANRPYLEKPIRPNELRRLVAQITGNRAGPPVAAS